jgi:SAM-dependent methyltransferase
LPHEVVIDGSAAAPDGSPVEVYARMVDLGESALVDSLVRPRSRILELGAGAGRVTKALLARGHQVVAVDESEAMLVYTTRLTTAVQSKIEDLKLRERFDCVLLCGHLINAPRAKRRRFLRVCRQHVASDGLLVIQRLDSKLSGWDVGVKRELPPFQVQLLDLLVEDGVAYGAMEYCLGRRAWIQHFALEILTDEDLNAELMSAGFEEFVSVDPGGTWVVVRPSTNPRERRSA